MKLQILVPHYKESADVIKPLLDSLAIQQSVDFSEIGVIICHDGKDIEDLAFDRSYPFEINQVSIKKGGVSAARNGALDAAAADYVMFCDVDDMFCHVCGLYIIFTEIGRGFDTLTSMFIEESRHPESKEVIYINHDNDTTFVHGKVHRRQFLIDYKIRWNDKLIIHEDSFFNILCREIAKDGRYCSMPFYLWKWRDESVCRHDPDYILKTYNNMLDSNDALIDEFERRGMDDKARFYVGFMIFDSYYTMNKNEWIDKTNKGYRDSVEKRFAKYYKKHRDEWNSISENEKMIISNGVRSRSVGEGMPMESMTMKDWLKHISRIGG